jgi:hypothetical protein
MRIRRLQISGPSLTVRLPLLLPLHILHEGILQHKSLRLARRAKRYRFTINITDVVVTKSKRFAKNEEKSKVKCSPSRPELKF